MKTFRAAWLGLALGLIGGAALAQTPATKMAKDAVGTTFPLAGQTDAGGAFHYRDLVEGLLPSGAPQAWAMDPLGSGAGLVLNSQEHLDLLNVATHADMTALIAAENGGLTLVGLQGAGLASAGGQATAHGDATTAHIDANTLVAALTPAGGLPVAPVERSYIMSTGAQNGSGTAQGPVYGANYGFSIAGSFGGDTATLTQTVDGNTTTVDTFTGTTSNCYAIGNNATLQLTTAGTAHTGIVASLNPLGTCGAGGKVTIAAGADVTEGGPASTAGDNTLLGQLMKLNTGSNGTETLNAGTAYAGEIGIWGYYPGVSAMGSMPSQAVGAYGQVFIDRYGGLSTCIKGEDGTLCAGTGVGADGASNTGYGLTVNARIECFNSTSWDRARSVQATDASPGTGVCGSQRIPTSAPSAGVNNSGLLSNTAKQLSAVAGNVFWVQVANGASADFVIIYDSSTLPTSGASLTASLVHYCMPIAANAGYKDNLDPPIAVTNGASLLLSTGCSTYTPPTNAAVFLTGANK